MWMKKVQLNFCRISGWEHTFNHQDPSYIVNSPKLIFTSLVYWNLVHSSFDIVTSALTMWSCKHMPLCWHTKISVVVTDILEVFTVFILSCTTVREVDYFWGFSVFLLKKSIKTFWKKWTAIVSWELGSKMSTKTDVLQRRNIISIWLNIFYVCLK